MNKEVSFVDKLGKPNLKKDDEEDFQFFIEMIDSYGLKLLNKTEDRFNIFQAVSHWIFMSTKHVQKIKDICADFLQHCYKQNSFPDEISFLQEIPEFFDIYTHKQHHQFFEGINFNILSHLLNRQIQLMTFTQKNKLLQTTIFNIKGNPVMHFMTVIIKDKLYYFPVENKIPKKNLKAQKKRSKNIGKLKKFIEKREIIEYKGHKSIKDEKQIVDDLKNINFNYLRVYMNSIGTFKKVFNSVSRHGKQVKHSLNEIKDLFNKYQLSVQKKTASSQRDQSNVNEGVLLENLDAESKKKIIFGNQTTIEFFKKSQLIRSKRQKKQEKDISPGDIQQRLTFETQDKKPMVLSINPKLQQSLMLVIKGTQVFSKITYRIKNLDFFKQKALKKIYFFTKKKQLAQAQMLNYLLTLIQICILNLL